MNPSTRHRASLGAAGFAALLAGAAATGCLEAPGIEDTWTRLEILGASPGRSVAFAPGDSLSLRVDARVTFRAIRTGALALELRRGDAALATSHPLTADAPAEVQSHDVQALLAATQPLAGDSRAITGFDHLMMDATLAFDAQVPADLDSSEALWVLLYFGEDEDVRRPGMADTVLVTPVSMDSLQILTEGYPLDLGGGTP